jgi:hypothetical protein
MLSSRVKPVVLATMCLHITTWIIGKLFDCCKPFCLAMYFGGTTQLWHPNRWTMIMKTCNFFMTLFKMISELITCSFKFSPKNNTTQHNNGFMINLILLIPKFRQLANRFQKWFCFRWRNLLRENRESETVQNLFIYFLILHSKASLRCSGYYWRKLLQ